jgi:hypothetical protein
MIEKGLSTIKKRVQKQYTRGEFKLIGRFKGINNDITFVYPEIFWMVIL